MDGPARAASDLPTVLRETSSAIPRSARIGSDDVPVQAQIGVAVFPQDGQTAEELIRNATIPANCASAVESNGIILYSSLARP